MSPLFISCEALEHTLVSLSEILFPETKRAICRSHNIKRHAIYANLVWGHSAELSSQMSIDDCSVQSLSHVRLFVTPWIAARQASLVYHQLLEFTQTHVHWVSDAIQPSHPLLSPSPPAPNPSQHQGLFQWVSSSHELAKVLEFQLQHQYFQWTPRLISFRMDWLVGNI